MSRTLIGAAVCTLLALTTLTAAAADNSTSDPPDTEPAEQPTPTMFPVDPDETRVLVAGSVQRPARFQYRVGWTLGQYIDAAGGLTVDADADATRILHANGNIVDASDATHVRPGDTIFVPISPVGDQAAPDQGLSAGTGAQRLGRGDVIVVPTFAAIAAQRDVDSTTDGPALPIPTDVPMYRDLTQTLRRFGLDYFELARERIRRLERADAEQPTPPADGGEQGDAEEPAAGQTTPRPRASGLVQDAITGFVGPIDQLNANVLMSIPHQRVVAPGDTLRITSWSPSSGEPAQELTLVVGPEGDVLVPPYGRLVVRGMTLSEFQQAAGDLLAQQTFTDLKLVATFDKLSTIQVVIAGHVFRPGTYAMSAAASSFNALYLCGGPNDAGSLRRIALVRGDNTAHVDFYDYLLSGEADQDQPLEDGDLIYFAPVGTQVAIRGEVQRPGIYELAEGDALAELLDMAGGLRSSGFAKSVQVDSVREHADRVIRTIDATTDLADSAELYDGDLVTVYPVLSTPVNTVSVVGRAKHPRVYELSKNMRISDLLDRAGGPREDAFLQRADLFRRNPDGETRALIPIALDKALERDPTANVPLREFDRLVIYAYAEVEWRPDREVGAQGAVVRPGNYPRADDMRLSDLLRMAGGVLPDGYDQRALLLRVDARYRLATSVDVDLWDQEAVADTALRDGDVLLVLTHEEAEWQPPQVVRVTGAVQQPGLVPYMVDMRVSDALFRAGGPSPDHAPAALLLRRDDRWDRVRISQVIDLRQAMDRVELEDIVLQPQDEIIIYRIGELRWEPDPEVRALGAVQSAGTYPRTEDMRVSDLIFRAGGVLPNAYLQRADLLRYLDDYQRQQTIAIDLGRALAGDESADMPLHDGDTLRILTVRSAEYVPEEVVTIHGAVQRPDSYIWTDGMRLRDILFLAGGVLPGHRSEAEIAHARGQDRTEVVRADILRAMENDEADNVPIEPGDVVSIMRSRTFYETPRTVVLAGEAAFPGTYVLEGDDRISDLIQRAGGVLETAYPAGATFARRTEYILGPDQEETLTSVWQEARARKDIEFTRALARARVEASRTGAALDPITDIVTEAAAPITSTLGVSAGILPSVGTAGADDDDGADVTIGPITAPGGAPAAVGAEDTRPATSVSLVTPARPLPNLLPGPGVVIDLVSILEDPYGEQDLALRDGDRITIPARANTVTVRGAVARPNTFVYWKGLKLKDCIELAGELADDADEDGITVIKMDGRAIRVDKLERIDPGDTILVTPRVVSERITNRLDTALSFIRSVAAIAATTVVLVAAISR